MKKETLDVKTRMAQAANLREDANERAKKIEKDCLGDLKIELKKLDVKRSVLITDIERISGKSIAPTKGKQRINGSELKTTILDIIKLGKNISCAELMKHEKMVALYATLGKEVPQQANTLTALVTEKKLDKTGTGKKSLYSIA